MFGYKVYINYILWKIGLRDVLPSAIVNRVIARENGEPLVKVEKDFRLRQDVSERLKFAQAQLPDGIFIKILSAYRSPDEQQKLWDQKISELRKEHSTLGESELKRLARLKIADPSTGGGGHQTGGAVDVTLCDKLGHELDMGGTYLVFDNNTPAQSVKNKNRKILFDVMIKAGFVNYPREWWHFSYGDRAWAAYSRRKYCSYSAI